MNWINLTQYQGIDFKQYLDLKGYSYSFLKRQINGIAPTFEPSEKVFIGSMVDDILTNPENVDVSADIYPIARSIASFLTDFIGFNALDAMEKQLSITGSIELENGLSMPVKSRLDMFVPGRVFDLKVTDAGIKDLDELIKYMGYDKQMFNYCKLTESEFATLIFYSKKDKKTLLKNLNFKNPSISVTRFWNDAVWQFGK